MGVADGMADATREGAPQVRQGREKGRSGRRPQGLRRWPSASPKQVNRTRSRRRAWRRRSARRREWGARRSLVAREVEHVGKEERDALVEVGVRLAHGADG